MKLNRNLSITPSTKISKPQSHSHKLSFTSIAAQIKFKKLRAHIQTGFDVEFDDNLEVLAFSICGMGISSVLQRGMIYPTLLCGFFVNMIPVNNSEGKLLYIDTMVRNTPIKLDENILTRALKLNHEMLGLDRENGYLPSFEDPSSILLKFQLHLSTVCDTWIAPNKFSTPLFFLYTSLQKLNF